MHPAAMVERLLFDDPPSVIMDVGCGRGTMTLLLSRAFTQAKFIATDSSSALLAVARQRLQEDVCASMVCADFHHLPLRDETCDTAIAAFCLYHSPAPRRAVAEIARCLRAGGRAVYITKSLDSYLELDQVIAAVGLDSQAAVRPSLYGQFHSGNIESVTSESLDLIDVYHHQHRFRFINAEHAAEYVATSPKYQLPQGAWGNVGHVARALDTELRGRSLEATSTVSYILARRR